MLTLLSHFLECQNLQLCSEKSMAVIENTNSEVMHNFILHHESTTKTVLDTNTHVTIQTGFHWMTRDNPDTFFIYGVSITNANLRQGLEAGATDVLMKLGASMRLGITRLPSFLAPCLRRYQALIPIPWKLQRMGQKLLLQMLQAYFTGSCPSLGFLMLQKAARWHWKKSPSMVRLASIIVVIHLM